MTPREITEETDSGGVALHCRAPSQNDGEKKNLEFIIPAFAKATAG